MKAEYIYNFLKFIDWKYRQKGDFVFCVAGKNPFDSDWEVFGKKQIRGKKIIFGQSAHTDPTRCDILFVSSTEASHVSEMIKEIGNSRILTISDTDGFSEKGIIINLRNETGKIRFEINPEAAEKAGIRISSKLLNLATTVHTTP